ncbi:hypothetical protein DZC72_14310 [Maribacter algicola]|uniref:Uncharacterized protein n=1 Tax=Maribacter algicola TaxID=2498892 RepID=A0A3R8RMM2_9FLAO|nr:Ig-like domain-containing protein [Maribacter algicola]RRQ48836.1 hypothetical protein DZC72_14310 [Maribacter algicola]
MKLTYPTLSKACLGLIASFSLYSCSKDADLLSDYVINNDAKDVLNKLVVDDSFYVRAQRTLILDVLSNDAFEDLGNVRIINTTAPELGTVVINDNNTLTYTVYEPVVTETTPPATETTPPATETTPPATETTPPATETAPEPSQPAQEPAPAPAAEEDTFTYTAEETDASGNTTTQQATVTVNIINDKAPTTGANVFYVTANGSAGNNGKSESAAWSLAHAFANAKAGDYVHIKAGNYGGQQLSINRSGSAGNPIVFMGYKNTPGDIVASQGSTFSYGDQANAAEMPLLDANNTGEGIKIGGSYVELQNFQVKDYSKGIQVTGNHVLLDNVVVLDMGNQNVSGYDGFGIHIMNTNNCLVQNSYIENATAEAFKIYGGGNNQVRYLEVRSDNIPNPTGYYILLTNTANNVVEDSRVERAPGLSHPGHGLVCKWNSKNNVFRRCETKYTNVEMNFSDVTGNLYEDIKIIGQGRDHYEGHVEFRNGANNNTIRNIVISDVSYAFSFSDIDDGFTPSPDTDAPNAGFNNSIQNATVENAGAIFRALPSYTIGGDINAFMRNNTFENCAFNNYSVLANLLMRNEGNAFINCSFKNGSNGVKAINGSPYRSDIINNIKFTNCTFENATQ